MKPITGFPRIKICLITHSVARRPLHEMEVCQSMFPSSRIARPEVWLGAEEGGEDGVSIAVLVGGERFLHRERVWRNDVGAKVSDKVRQRGPV